MENFSDDDSSSDTSEDDFMLDGYLSDDSSIGDCKKKQYYVFSKIKSFIFSICTSISFLCFLDEYIGGEMGVLEVRISTFFIYSLLC